MKRLILSVIAAVFAAAAPAAAEMELSFYMGVQSVQKSKATGNLPVGGAVNRKIDWEGNPLDNPPYYGMRAMWWTQNNLGFGLEFTHTKAYASSADKAALGLDKLELSDGHNIITANIMKRWPGYFANERFTPYIGAGLGVAVPHVDAKETGAAARTFGYEVTGPAARAIAGIKYDINDKWAIFSEYQTTWSDNEITIKPGGKLKTTIITHAVNVGLSYSF